VNAEKDTQERGAVDSRPGVIHRGVIGGGAISDPGASHPGEFEVASIATPGRSGAGRKLVIAMVFVGILVATLATVMRDGRDGQRTDAKASGQH
jgi:hypothetical protein